MMVQRRIRPRNESSVLNELLMATFTNVARARFGNLILWPAAAYINACGSAPSSTLITLPGFRNPAEWEIHYVITDGSYS